MPQEGIELPTMPVEIEPLVLPTPLELTVPLGQWSCPMTLVLLDLLELRWGNGAARNPGAAQADDATRVARAARAAEAARTPQQRSSSPRLKWYWSCLRYQRRSRCPRAAGAAGAALKPPLPHKLLALPTPP